MESGSLSSNGHYAHCTTHSQWTVLKRSRFLKWAELGYTGQPAPHSKLRKETGRTKGRCGNGSPQSRAPPSAQGGRRARRAWPSGVRAACPLSSLQRVHAGRRLRQVALVPWPSRTEHPWLQRRRHRSPRELEPPEMQRQDSKRGLVLRPSCHLRPL